MKRFALLFVVLAACSARAAENTIETVTEDDLAPIAAKIDAANGGRFDLYFNSPGGSVFDGLDFIRKMEAAQRRGVRFYCTADLAASMGAVIFSACDIRLALPRAMFLIHPASSGARGNARDMRENASVLEVVSDAMLRQVARVMNIPFEELKRRSEAGGYWLDAGRALETGLVQEILP